MGRRVLIAMFALVAAGLLIGAAGAAGPARQWRESIAVTITSPTKITPICINQQMTYTAAAACRDQFSDDGGVTWHDFGPDTKSPRPTIVWSTSLGAFLTFSGNTAIFQAPDESHLPGDQADAAIYATAMTGGKDIFGGDPIVDPMISLAPPPSTAPAAVTDRARQIDRLRRAIAGRLGDPRNIQQEFLIGNLLCFNRDDGRHQSAYPMQALAVFESIVSRYDHKDHYEPEPPHTQDNPQYMVPRSAILAASILMTPRPQSATRPDDRAAAGKYIDLALDDLAWSYQHRRHEWLSAPKPAPPTIILDPDQGDPTLAQWQDRRAKAAAGHAFDLIGSYGVTLVATAVRLYCDQAGGDGPRAVIAAMRKLEAAYPSTPIAAEAHAQAERAGS